ncbi:MAG: Phosphoribosylglycinamide formyltransferase [Flavobacteriales bacterium]|nr:Phosphoribosylglycinamide formyltransferase [Flavobacteriales bacterium]
MMKRIAIFASGSGSNAENIYDYFKANDKVEVSLILTNNSTAKVIERANRLAIPCEILDRQQFYETTKIVDLLKSKNVDLIVLAGFLWLIPEQLVKAFPDKIINIHPALLPKYGGKGMYGDKVHETVVANNEKESGITIHYVNEKYDEGNIIFQAKCEVLASDNASDLAKKVHALEYQHFPVVIEKLLFTRI